MERESGVTLNHGILTMLQPNWKEPTKLLPFNFLH